MPRYMCGKSILSFLQPSPSSSVKNAVASVKEETARAAKEIMSEQLREHQEAQSADEHFSWLKDSSQVRECVHTVHQKLFHCSIS